MFVSHHTLKWTRTCRSHGRHPHAHTAHFLLNRHTGVRYYTDLYFKTAQVVPARTMEVSSNAAIVAALSAGFGQSLISEAAVPAGVPVQRELGDEFVRRFYALVPRSGLTHDQRELAETIIAALRG